MVKRHDRFGSCDHVIRRHVSCKAGKSVSGLRLLHWIDFPRFGYNFYLFDAYNFFLSNDMFARKHAYMVLFAKGLMA